MIKTYDFFTARAILWPEQPFERKVSVDGSRERRRGRASDRTLRAFVLDAYQLAAVPVRVLSIRRRDS